LIFGLFPALRVSGVDLRGPLSGGVRAGGDRKGDRIRNGLILFEIATATILLASSALLIRSFQALQTTDSGFETENILTMRMNLPAGTYGDDASMARAVERITERIEALPGVDWSQPWGPGRPGLGFNFQSSVPDGMVVERLSDSPLARRHHVGPGTLEDMGISLLRGRGILASDRADTQPVVVVGGAMAAELWPGEDAIGKRFHAFVPPGAPIPAGGSWTVVGVVADANHGGRVPFPGGISTLNDAYYPMAQRPERAFTMLVKSAGPPDVGPIRQAVREFDPNIPIFQVATVAENFAQEEGGARFAAQLMGGFGLAALLLAALGVFGVVAFSVTQRTREIGVRAALGAEPRRMLNQFVVHGLKLAAGGVTLGAITAFGATRGIQAVLPNVPSMDGIAVSIAAGLLVLVAALSCLIPAIRATRIDPVVALKGD
jgi:putative ABC transport system permease protein